jgi:eukaryotic-like serine/threonine-protein kinase
MTPTWLPGLPHETLPMSVSCPYCNGLLNPKGLKPGQFKPKCPKCQHQFLLVVPESPEGTISVKKLGTQDTSGPAKAPPPRKVANADADPNSTGAFTEYEKPSPHATAMFQPSGVDDPNSTGAFTEVDQRPDRTQAFSPSAVQDPNTTGAFTEVDRDINKTGAFGPSGAGEGTEMFSPSEAGKGNPDQTSAFSDDQPAAKAKPKSGPDEIPDKLGGYEVVKVLGKGGMGAVLLGKQLSLNRKVALKIMHSRLAKDPAFVARFTREAYAAAQLVHHNVIQVYDIGQDTGIHYFSMEFVNGKSLMDEVKDKGKLDVEVAVGYILQAARGLRFGHVQGMIHRDIKPDNLMLNNDGIVKVADLGLVKLPTPDVPQNKGAEASLGDDDETDTGMTRAGVVMGTPSYMAPEQSRDSSTVDARADIYSLGCTLYVLVTGKPPFSGKSALEVMSKHQTPRAEGALGHLAEDARKTAGRPLPDDG